MWKVEPWVPFRGCPSFGVCSVLSVRPEKSAARVTLQVLRRAEEGVPVFTATIL